MKFAFDESNALYGPIRTMVEDQFRDAKTQPSLRVHEKDEMFRASIGLGPRRYFGKMVYFRTGLMILDALRQTAKWHDKPLDEMDRVLDFAAGYGRSTRFLAGLLPGDRIWASEILPDAVAFQESEFGVNALQSSTDPADFECEVSFDLIFVSSLFSHLPEATWGAWLERLYSLLAPGGLLVFSVHDETLVTAPHQMPDTGLLYLPVNEGKDSWDVADYGTAFVTEGFVARTIKERLVQDAYIRLPKSLSFHQDLYIVRESGGELNAATPFLRGPNGGVSSVVSIDARMGAFKAAGWVVDMDGGTSPEVILKVGTSQCVEVRPTIDSPDLKNIFHPGDGEGLMPSEWTAPFSLPVTTLRPKTAVTVVARSVDSRKEFVLDWYPVKELLPVRYGQRFVEVGQRLKGLAWNAQVMWRREGPATLMREAVTRLRDRL